MAGKIFYEMRDAVADTGFRRKRELETKAEHTISRLFSKYQWLLSAKICLIGGERQG